MKIKVNDRKLAFGSVSLSIALLVIAAVIILNVAFTALAYKFSLYTPLSGDVTYDITDACIDYIESTVIPKISDGKTVNIYFCDDEEIIEADSDSKNILASAKKIENAFEGKIKVDFLNVWENPKIAREYGITSSTDVAIVYDGRCEIIKQADFFLWNTQTQMATAYNGEKRFAAGLLKAVRESNPMCYITVNHGELLEGYELLYMLADAGYNYTYLDLMSYDIPKDCDLIVTFDPRQDLTVKNTVSGISETEKLEKYMSDGGNLWFFASADTFLAGSLDEFETLLAKYGVKFSHSENSDGIEECIQIKDSNHSTSVDGYAIFAKPAQNWVSSDILSGIGAQFILAGATAIVPAEGFTQNNDGVFTSSDGKTQLSPLLITHEGAEGWANGRIVQKSTKDAPFTLMSLSTTACENGKTASLMACASTAFASTDALQSASYGNSTLLSSISKYTGNTDAPTSLVAKPFPTTEMKTLTVKNATVITIVSAVIPTLALAICGTVILVKRKNRV